MREKTRLMNLKFVILSANTIVYFNSTDSNNIPVNKNALAYILVSQQCLQRLKLTAFESKLGLLRKEMKDGHEAIAKKLGKGSMRHRTN